MRRSTRSTRTAAVPANSPTHFKASRRCSSMISHLDVSLRFTTIFVLAVAICEFSGLSQAVADAYTAMTLRIAMPTDIARPSAGSSLHARSPTSSTPMTTVSLLVNPANAQTVHQRHIREESQEQDDHQQQAFSLGDGGLVRRRPALSNLYYGIHPDSSIEYAQSTRRIPPPPTDSPTFMLETHWSETDYNKVCRIHNACVKRDSTLLVHPTLKAHEDTLHSCAVPRIEYMKSPSQFVQNMTTAAFDLFGHTPARFHIPHFLTDILPLLYAVELIRPTTTHSSRRTKCVHPTLPSCPKNIVMSKLRTALYAEDRVLSMSVSSWVPQLAAMLPGHPYLFFPSTMFSKVQSGQHDDIACFRSVVTFSRQHYMYMTSEWLGEENRLFERYGLSRKSAIRSPPATADATSKFGIFSLQAKCRINVLIINRFGWERHNGFLLGRDIVNVDEVKAHIERDAAKLKLPAVSVSVRIEYFENKTFVEQVDIMQRADVVVGVHGAGLSNLLFARKDTPVIEVFPFTYYAGPFPSVARALFLRYAYVISEPDTKTFLECIEMRAKRLNDSSLSRKAKELWTEALKRRREHGEQEFLKTHKFTDPRMSNLKMCARTQRMKINAIETARRVSHMAQGVCGAPVEM